MHNATSKTFFHLLSSSQQTIYFQERGEAWNVTFNCCSLHEWNINQQTSKSADANPHIVNVMLRTLCYVHQGKREKKLSNESDRCPLGGEPLKTLTEGSSDVDCLGQACWTLLCCGQLRKNLACMLKIFKSIHRMKFE